MGQARSGQALHKDGVGKWPGPDDSGTGNGSQAQHNITYRLVCASVPGERTASFSAEGSFHGGDDDMVVKGASSSRLKGRTMQDAFLNVFQRETRFCSIILKFKKENFFEFHQTFQYM